MKIKLNVVKDKTFYYLMYINNKLENAKKQV